MHIKDVDIARDEAHRVETDALLRRHDKRLRELEAALIGLKDRVEKDGARYAGIRNRLHDINNVLDIAATGIDSLNDRISALKEREPPLSGCRETAWVVKVGESAGLAVFLRVFNGVPAVGTYRDIHVRLFERRDDAVNLARLLGIGSAVQVYTDTMEEVGA